MAEPINLNRARKDKARAEAKASAVSNRAAFGRTKTLKQAERAEAERVARLLDGKRREEP